MAKFVIMMLVGLLIVGLLAESFTVELKNLFNRLLTGNVSAMVTTEIPSSVFLPVVRGGERYRDMYLDRVRAGEQWFAIVEIAQHCLLWDEILDNAEFPHASQLSDLELDQVYRIADDICVTVGAPVPPDYCLFGDCPEF